MSTFDFCNRSLRVNKINYIRKIQVSFLRDGAAKRDTYMFGSRDEQYINHEIKSTGDA